MKRFLLCLGLLGCGQRDPSADRPLLYRVECPSLSLVVLGEVDFGLPEYLQFKVEPVGGQPRMWLPKAQCAVHGPVR